MSRGHGWRAAWPLGLAVVVALSGCASQGPRDSAGQVTAPAPVDAFSLQVGDCTGPLTTGTVEKVPLLPCGQPHSWEVFAATELGGDDYPGAGAVEDEAEEFCQARFKKFVGVSVAKSDYDLNVLQPTKQTWNSAGDRAVTCLAGKEGGKIEGSLEGVKK